VIFGAGGVGLNAVSGARLAGASQIVVIDIHPKRLEAARGFGATDVIDSTASEPVEVVRDLSAEKETHNESSHAFLDRYGRPEHPADLPKFNTVASIDDVFDSGARWNVADVRGRTQQIELKPRLVTSDLRTRLQAAIHGIGIALLPEQVVSAPLKEGVIERVLPEWAGTKNILHLVYPTPRGMLPSVRSLIDYLLIHVPSWLQERTI
jgi:DNA-binding transcriptional LysR family regulator